MRGGLQEQRLKVVQNTEREHNVIVCTLCSCYPIALLGPSPTWYKSPAYRSRVVRDPRAVLREFGFVLEGAVWVVSGAVRSRARRGDGFLIRPSEPHRLENSGRRAARVLWVSAPPSF